MPKFATCDRCGHLATDHDRKTKYSDHACSKRNKSAQQVFDTTKEGAVHKIAESNIQCICDGLVMAVQT